MNPNLPELPAELFILIVVLAIWTFVIKALALYRAGSLKQKGWFVALLLLNTLGILELVYLLAISKRNK